MNALSHPSTNPPCHHRISHSHHQGEYPGSALHRQSEKTSRVRGVTLINPKIPRSLNSTKKWYARQSPSTDTYDVRTSPRWPNSWKKFNTKFPRNTDPAKFFKPASKIFSYYSSSDQISARHVHSPSISNITIESKIPPTSINNSVLLMPNRANPPLTSNG